MPKTLLIDAIIETKNNPEPAEVFFMLAFAYKEQPYIGTSVMNENNETPLIIAAKETNLLAIQWLLNEKQHLGRGLKDLAIDKVDNNHMTALCHAVNYEDKPHELTPPSDEIKKRRAIIHLLVKAQAHISVDEAGIRKANAFFKALKARNFYFINVYFENYYFKKQYADLILSNAIVKDQKDFVNFIKHSQFLNKLFNGEFIRDNEVILEEFFAIKKYSPFAIFLDVAIHLGNLDFVKQFFAIDQTEYRSIDFDKFANPENVARIKMLFEIRDAIIESKHPFKKVEACKAIKKLIKTVHADDLDEILTFSKKHLVEAELKELTSPVAESKRSISTTNITLFKPRQLAEQLKEIALTDSFWEKDEMDLQQQVLLKARTKLGEVECKDESMLRLNYNH